MTSPQELWIAGAQALQNIGGPKSLYACPICLRGFSLNEIDSLSKDHVPPSSVSENCTIVLTCKRCNNQSGGSAVEGDMSRAKRFREFKMSDRFSDLDCKLTVKGEKTEANVRISWNSSEEVAEITFRGNRPDTPRHFHDEFQRAVREHRQPELDIALLRGKKVGQFDPDKVAIAWLKAGYLAAFAQFGYSYATRDSLKIVREQLKQPAQKSIVGYYSFDPGSVEIQDIVLTKDQIGMHGVLAASMHGGEDSSISIAEFDCNVDYFGASRRPSIL